jgi:chromosome segregation ATPase
MPDDDDRRSGMMTVKPDPDPTVLTTEALQREIHTLKEFFQAEVKGVREVLTSEIKTVNERFNGISERFKATEENKKLAFDAAEKANGKTESLLTKLIDALSKRIDELRDSEQRIAGSKEGTTSKDKSVGDMINHVITLAALGVAIIALFVKHSTV